MTSSAKDDFVFDVLGASPEKLRANLNSMSEKDSAIKRARQINQLLRFPSGRGTAAATIKLAQKYSDEDYPRRFLTALSMYRKADLIEKERQELTGDKKSTIGIKYSDLLATCGYYMPNMTMAGNKAPMMGKRTWAKHVYVIPGYAFYTRKKHPKENFPLWQFHKKYVKGKNASKFIPAYIKKTGATTRQAQEALADISYLKYVVSKANDIFREKSKAKAIAWVEAEMEKRNIPEDYRDAIFKAAIKNAQRNKKKRDERLKKIVNVVKDVGKIALSAAKAIPGVGEAVKAAENAVKSIPGVKEALDIADKVKGSIKEAKALGDNLKLDKLKDLGNNPNVRKALAVDKLVKGTIEQTVNQIKRPDIATIVKAAELVAPDKVKVAMNLVKQAQEMDPSALLKIKSIQQMADAGLVEAQKALATMQVAVKIQKTAKEEALLKQKQWQYW